jgi:TRAP-type C4-dicarboxylate transport system permease large subunit
MKSIQTLSLEALVVGLLLVILYMVTRRFMDSVPAVFVSGAAFHLICEATGVNAWYARNYFK